MRRPELSPLRPDAHPLLLLSESCQHRFASKVRRRNSRLKAISCLLLPPITDFYCNFMQSCRIKHPKLRDDAQFNKALSKLTIGRRIAKLGRDGVGTDGRLPTVLLGRRITGGRAGVGRRAGKRVRFLKTILG